MADSTHAAGRPRIHIARQGWRHARKIHSLQSHADLAKTLDVSETTIWRVLTKEVQRPGEEFMAAALDTFFSLDDDGEPRDDHFGFDDLFVVRRS